MLAPASTFVAVQVPPVGLVEVRMLPAESTATHRSEGEAVQETLMRSLGLSMAASVHAPGPPVGLVDQAASPELSTATQRVAEVQDTALKYPPPPRGSEER